MASITIKEYFENYLDHPLIDVRSPGEYEKAHIPSAVNIALFDNDERAEVGTIYKQQGKDIAIERGLEIAGTKMKSIVVKAKSVISDGCAIVHCWRGGKRSESVAWLLTIAGFTVWTIDGGYKAYRNFILNEFKVRAAKFMVIGGATGSGKTEILHQVLKLGEQIIDLEGLANHKGSAFGALGQREQPSSEQFENFLFEEFRMLDRSRRIWIENESRTIGKVFIPDGFWEHFKSGVLFHLQMSTEVRLERLIKEYACFTKEEIIDSFDRIKKKLGGLNYQQAVDAVQINDYAAAGRIALWYYDKSYNHSVGKWPFTETFDLEVNKNEPDVTAQRLISIANEKGI